VKSLDLRRWVDRVREYVAAGFSRAMRPGGAQDAMILALSVVIGILGAVSAATF